MDTRRVTLVVLGLMFSSAIVLSQVPSNVEIRNILADRIGDEKAGLAIVVGVIDANGRRVVAYGSLANGDNRRLDGDTVFEIGSMTRCSRR